MTNQAHRRDFLRRIGTGAVVIAFNTSTRSWVTAAEPAGHSLSGLPHFDGQLVTDDASLTAASDDFGHIVHRRPVAVLQPGSVSDVVLMIQYARQHHIQVAARGQGHCTQGQDQVAAGVVIDMSFLHRIRSIDSTSVWVDGGVKWIDLLQYTLTKSLTPPVFTDYIGLSVGGTLSVGGIGGQAFRWGTQTDNALELEVVTGAGELVTCSQFSHVALYEACRAGLGQYGIITGARIRLIPALPMARTYTANYTDLGTFLADQLRAIDAEESRFDYVEGSLVPLSSGGWEYQIQLTKYFTTPPNDQALLAGLHFIPGTLTTTDQTYFDFINRLAPTVAFLISIGAWSLPHPWVDLFLPAEATQSFVSKLVSTLTLDDVGQGPVLLYPANRFRALTPLFRLPDSGNFFLLALLRNAVPPTPDVINAQIQANRQLYDQCVAVGGKRYPIDSVPMTKQDWQKHYGLLWPGVVAAKQYFDPDNILTPGQGIF